MFLSRKELYLVKEDERVVLLKKFIMHVIIYSCFRLDI